MVWKYRYSPLLHAILHGQKKMWQVLLIKPSIPYYFRRAQFYSGLGNCSYMIKSDCLGLLDDLSCCILIKIGDDLEHLYPYPFAYHEDIDISLLGGVFSLLLVYKCHPRPTPPPPPIVPLTLVKELGFFIIEGRLYGASSLIKFEIDDMTKKDILET